MGIHLSFYIYYFCGNIYIHIYMKNSPHTGCCIFTFLLALQWRHNGHEGVSNHQHHDCLLKRLFRRRSKKTLKLRINGLCAGNSAVTGEFPAQMSSNAENVSIWWHHHGFGNDFYESKWSVLCILLNDPKSIPMNLGASVYKISCKHQDVLIENVYDTKIQLLRVNIQLRISTFY